MSAKFGRRCFCRQVVHFLDGNKLSTSHRVWLCFQVVTLVEVTDQEKDPIFVDWIHEEHGLQVFSIDLPSIAHRFVTARQWSRIHT